MSEEKATPKRTTKKTVAAAEPAPAKKAVTAAKVKTASPKAAAAPKKKTTAATPAKSTESGKSKKAASAPAEAKAPVARKAATPRKKAATATALVDKPAAPSQEERQRWIATAAYHRAEKRGFVPGYEAQDWFEAEAEIDALVGKA